MSRTYAGASAADRTAERRTRLLDAAVEIVGTQGVSALGMRTVCREAGLSQKFFYESFADVDALLHAAYAAAADRLRAAVTSAASGGDLSGTIDAAARLMEDDPRVCRILLVEPVADLRLRRYVRKTLPAMAVSALSGRIDGDPTDPAIKMRFSAVLGALISLFIEWTEGNLGDDREAFVAHAVGVVTVLLGG